MITQSLHSRHVYILKTLHVIPNFINTQAIMQVKATKTPREEEGLTESRKLVHMVSKPSGPALRQTNICKLKYFSRTEHLICCKTSFHLTSVMASSRSEEMFI